MLKINYKSVLSLSLVICFTILTTPLFSQNGAETIFGLINDSKGNAISGVTISVLDGFTNTLSDNQGKFVIQVTQGKRLVFVADGFQPLIVNISGEQNQLDITLLPLDIEPAYKVGYSSRNKTNLTAAVSMVDGEMLSSSPVATLDQAIQGKVNGLTMLKTSGSEPGWTSYNFYVRGIGTFGNGRSPLFLVDNVERDFTQLDPEEIESLTVMKDAAANVQYGMRSANGVISIQTKRGYIGKPEISLKAQLGMQQPFRLPDYLNAREYVKYLNIALKNDGQPIPADPRYDETNYDGKKNPYLFANTDWYSEFLKPISPQQMYRLSVRGGTDIIRYYVLFGVTNQEGIYKFTEVNRGFSTQPQYNRYNVRSNIDIKISNNLEASLDLAGRLETKSIPASSASSIFTALSSMPPTLPIKNEDESIAGNSIFRSNPYGLIAKSGYTNQYYRYLQGNVELNYKLGDWIKGLSAEVLFAFDTDKMYGRSRYQNFAVYQQNLDNTYSKFGEDTELDLAYTQSSDNGSLQSTIIGGLNYELDWEKKHHLGAELKYMQSLLNVAGNNPDYKNQNLFGRVSYGFRNRYVGEFAYAYSGSENFIAENRYGFFPTGSLAWILSNEPFMSSVNDKISFLKLRMSYGMLGNGELGIARFSYQESFGTTAGYIFGSGFAGSDGSYEGRINNPNIGYERSYNFNIGIDAEFFKNKFTVSFDYFNNDRRDIITTRTNTLSSIVGQVLPFENLGSVLNRGFELTLAHNNKVNDFSYNIRTDISFARNKITYQEEVAGRDPWLYATGRSVSQQWGFEALGFFNSQEEIESWAKSTYGIVKPGDIKYKDQNKDNIINEDDRIPLGYPSIPEWNFGLTMGAAYKNFDFNLLFNGIANRTIFSFSSVFMGIQNNSKATATVYDSWQKGVNETTALYPRLSTETTPHNRQNSTVWSHNASYFRLQNSEIGYTFSKILLAKLKLKDIRIFINGYNLISFDYFKKYSLSAEYPNAGINAYPDIRIYNIGMNIKF